jgi:hypothetical protein
LATVNEQEFPAKFKAKETGCKIPGAWPLDGESGGLNCCRESTFAHSQNYIIYNGLGIIKTAANLTKKLGYCTSAAGEVFAIGQMNRARG